MVPEKKPEWEDELISSEGSEQDLSEEDEDLFSEDDEEESSGLFQNFPHEDSEDFKEDESAETELQQNEGKQFRTDTSFFLSNIPQVANHKFPSDPHSRPTECIRKLMPMLLMLLSLPLLIFPIFTQICNSIYSRCSLFTMNTKYFCAVIYQNFIKTVNLIHCVCQSNIVTVTKPKRDHGFYVNGSICGEKCPFLIDTGASKSILSKGMYKKIAQKVDLSPGAVPRLQLADGTPLETLGTICDSIQVGPVSMKQVLIVANISDDGIIGLDFLRQHHCSLDLKMDEIVIGGRRISCGKGAPIVEVGRVECVESVIIPARTEMIVSAYVENAPGGAHGLIEANPKFEMSTSVKVASSLNVLNGSVVPVRVMNPTSVGIEVRAGVTIGYAQEVIEVCTIATENDRFSEVDCPMGIMSIKDEELEESPRPGDICKGQLPEHLHELYDDICENVTDSEELQNILKLLSDFQGSFSKGKDDLGQTSIVEHAIDTADAHPIKQRPRRTPLAFRGEEEKEIKSMLERGVIQPSTSPWSSCVCLVRKKDGTPRFCIDYRLINAITVKDSYPLPRISDCLDSLAGATCFSTMDLLAGYWQIRVKESDRPKTAFVTKSGLYEFLLMPFGLVNAPSTFERCMETVLRGLQWTTCLIYLDDVIVFSDSVKDMTSRLSIVLKRLMAAGLKLKPSKCKFYQKKVEFLGHVVSKDGIATNPEKISAVVSWPAPTSVTEVRSFLGLCSYYRKFIRNFARVSAPLTNLTKKDVPFKWDQTAQNAMDVLKDCLVTAPILSYPDTTCSFILDCDASDTGIGAVLSQKSGEVESVISYGSKTLSKAERRYCVTRKELLAIVFFVKHFRHYLLGRHFLVRTDHQPLKWLFGLKEPTGQVARWIELLQSYDFLIEYRPGHKNGNADGLSRAPCHPERCQCHFDTEELPCGPCPKCAKKSSSGNIGISRVTTRRSTNQQTPVEETWINRYTAAELRDAQLQDSHVAPVLLWKEELSERPSATRLLAADPETRHLWLSWTALTVRDRVLYKTQVTENGNEHLQLVVPRSLRQAVLKQCHDILLSGHLGEKKTLSRILKFATWFKLRESIHIYIQKCQVCQVSKRTSHRGKAPLGTISVGAPLDKIATDLMGPLPITPRGHQHILVVQDYFTKWVEFYPVPNTQADTCARVILNEFISRYGTPLSLHSDQGRNYESDLFQEFCKMLEIRKTRTTPRHPAGNGMVERTNSTLLDMIRSYLEGRQSDWDLHLGCLAGAYRSAIHSSTGFSPNQLMLGREVNQPVNILYGSPIHQDNTPGEYVSGLQENLRRCHELTRVHLKQSSERHKRNYDTHIAKHTYQVGDIVWYLNEQRKRGRCPKLQPIWFGPCMVFRKLSDLNYEIQLHSKGQKKIVHFDKLKKYHGEMQNRSWLLKLKRRLTPV